jgi:DNA-binding transcriptional regulator GbsR (MarR family)
MELCRCAYLILGILRAVNATDPIHGLTIAEIHSFEKLSKPNTIHKKIKLLDSLGLIREGIRAGRAKTYYLTGEGAMQLPTQTTKTEKELDANEKQ